MKSLKGTAAVAWLGGCAATALAAWAGGACAQTASVTTTAVEEVVVTAQRRSERLVDVPMSVTVISGDLAERSGAVSLHDLASVAAGVQVNFAGCCTQPAIRGISTLTTGIGFENNVALYVDGFYAPDNITINADLANISSVEVLKGPQGTLWGRNATGGAILINTLAPSSTLTGRLQATYARYDDRRLGGYISGPISERLRYSIAAYGRKSDGYNKLLDTSGRPIGDVTPERQASVRAKLEFDLADKLTATLGYNYGLSDDPRGNLFTITDHPAPTLPRPPLRTNRPYTSTTNYPTNVWGMTNEGTLKLVYKGSAGTLTSYTGVALRKTKLSYDFDATYLDLFSASQSWNQDTFQQGLDFVTTGIENFDLVVGGTYYRDRMKANFSDSYANGLLSNRFFTSLSTEAWAAYVDGTYKFAGAWSLNLGARYTRERKAGYYVTVLPSGLPQGLPGRNSKTFSDFTPRASLRYELGPRTNIYATVARGFRSGGFQPLGAANPALYTPYSPEKITSYEIGYKTDADRYSFSVAAFLYDYRDLQVGVTIPNPIGTGLINQVINAKKAEVYGVDAELNAEPIDNLHIRFGAAWLHARYKDFATATGTGLNVATGLNVTNQPQDWSGQQMTRAPNFSANLGVDYEFADVMAGSLLIGANIHYTASYTTNNASIYGPLAGALAREQRYRQGAYTLANAQATWTDPSEHYQIGAFVNNLTDKRYRLTYSGGGFGDYSSWASPRTYGVRLGYKF